jgi:crotonobetainyl-CoA:carnitine CoA-transferase CaiB-like acyl-CoA transferase
MADRDGPLDGLKVLDFTTMMSGPLGTRLFADMGADVVKVESPAGDHNRSRTPIRGGMSRYFAQLNAGKCSVVLNLKDPGDLALAQRLASRCDVLVENNRPGVMGRLGLGYAAVAADNPGVVYCSISGYGQSGPSAQDAAYAPNIHAASGFDLANLSYQDQKEKPANTAIFVADVLGAVYACTAIEAALLRRVRTGRGDHIDVAMFDAVLNLLVYEVQIAQTGEEPRRSIYMPMPAVDGYVSVAPVNQKQFSALMPIIGRPEWVEDERWSTVEARELNWGALMEEVAVWTAERSVEECLARFAEGGIAAARYRTPAEALDDPHVMARGVLASRQDEGGTYALVNAPFQFAEADVHARGEAPQLGADREPVLSRWLEDDS